MPVVSVQEGHHGQGLVSDGRGQLELDGAHTLQQVCLHYVSTLLYISFSKFSLCRQLCFKVHIFLLMVDKVGKWTWSCPVHFKADWVRRNHEFSSLQVPIKLCKNYLTLLGSLIHLGKNLKCWKLDHFHTLKVYSKMHINKIDYQCTKKLLKLYYLLKLNNSAYTLGLC